MIPGRRAGNCTSPNPIPTGKMPWAGLLCFLLLLVASGSFAQDKGTTDTNKDKVKKVGSFGKDTAGRRQPVKPEQSAAQLMRYEGKIIRHIRIRRIGFEMNVTDSAA